MTDTKVWFITGTSRGLGIDLVEAALAAGHSVVATGRRLEDLEKVYGARENLLLAKLDVTNSADAANAVAAAVDRFGRIDVLLNNAGNCRVGYFEDLTLDEIRQQLETNLLGPMNVTQAVLPVMRRQGSGHVLSVSSGAGMVGFEFSSAYATSKFAVEGWMESLRAEVAPSGIRTTIIDPGMFRTELISDTSMIFAEQRIPDYAERTKAQRKFWNGAANQQPGDPRKLAKALVAIVGESEPPVRFLAGSDAMQLAQLKIDELQHALRDRPEVSGNMAFPA